MEMACLLVGLSEALRARIAADVLRPVVDELALRLRRNQSSSGGLFSFGREVLRKNLHRARLDGRLGSFASQVYPTLALASHARATGDEESLRAAIRCAGELCEVQGPEGQWWWIYHPRRRTVVLRYPVYTVHQDAMGPMALCAAALVDGATDRYDEAIHRSLRWFEHRSERPEDHLLDAERGVVWRAVQRDDPAVTRRLGIGRGELARLGLAAWFGNGDERPFREGHVCLECRPYHLGWILLADAMFGQLVEARG
jgi:hypothetical protein